MREVRVAAAQFEARDGDKEYNLDRIAALTDQAAAAGAQVVAFHECCITGYTFLMTLTRSSLLKLAEKVPEGPSTKRLVEIAGKYKVSLLAGLLEVDEAGKLYNTYVAVTPGGPVAKHRKIHTFISKHISPGRTYTVFDLPGFRAGILICYDNNLPENVRITTLMGAEVIFMPHVTGGTESPMPGRGKIPLQVWENRGRDPVPCRLQFEGPKGRRWLMRWLPARAYENGVYAVFSNAVGIDYDSVRPGLAMILDPYGEILAESRALGDDVVTAALVPEKIPLSSGFRYLCARRPELYGKLVEPLPEDLPKGTRPGWRLQRPPDLPEQ